MWFGQQRCTFRLMIAVDLRIGYSHCSLPCPAATDSDPYLPCVDNRMRLFNDSIRKLLTPELRRKDTHTTLPVPGYMYRTSALTCVKIPKGFLPGIVQTFPGFFNWLADWAIDEEGNLELGPLPKGFPINALVNTKLLPDNDEPGGGLVRPWPSGLVNILGSHASRTCGSPRPGYSELSPTKNWVRPSLPL